MIETVSISSTNVAGAAARPAPPSRPRQEPQSEPVMTAAGVAARIRIDNKLDIAILEFRATDTGDVVNQYPTKAQIQAFGRAAELDARREAAEARAEAAEPAEASAYVPQDNGAEVSETPEAVTAPATASVAPAASSYTPTGAPVGTAEVTTEQTV